MKKNILFYIFYILSITSYSQTTFRYFNKNWIVVPEDSAVYKQEKCPKDGICKTYYITGELFEEASLKNYLRDGLVILYFKNGTTWAKMNYKDGKKYGNYFEWYPDGLMKEEGIHESNGYIITTFWDSTGVQLIKDGTGTFVLYHKNRNIERKGEFVHGRQEGEWNYWYENGEKYEQINYKNNMKDGESKGWYKNGQKYYIENYKEGNFIDGVSFNKSGYQIQYTILSTEVSYTGGFNKFSEIISSRMKKYSENLKLNTETKIYVEMIIDTTGKLISPTIKGGINSKYDQKLIEVIMETHSWIPATYRGQKVARRVRLPLVIKSNY